MDAPARDRLLPLYAELAGWYREHVEGVPASAGQEYQERARALISRLPHPEEASPTEMRAVLQEVRGGLLEWAYGARGAGREQNHGEAATEALESTGGPLSAEERSELSAHSPLWPFLSSGEAARLLLQAEQEIRHGRSAAAGTTLQDVRRLSQRRDDPVTGARAILMQAQLETGVDMRRALLEEGLAALATIPAGAADPVRRQLEEAYAAVAAPETGADDPAGADGGRVASPGAGSGTTAEIPFDPSAFEWSPSVAAALEAAALDAGGGRTPAPVSSSLVLFRLAEPGRAVADPQWAGDFLRTALAPQLARFDSARRRYLEQRGLDVPSDAAAPSRAMTSGLQYVLAFAQQIARRASDSPRVHGRHLLAALICDRPGAGRTGSGQRLEECGLDLPLLRQRVYEWVKGYGERDDEWRALLVGSTDLPRRPASFHADDTRGPDLLDIDREVIALATLIGARTVSPPLSIGLFGHWGSGKTFFMRQLRRAVAALSAEARSSGRMQRDEPFYKHIVQIEFNAWHYVEGNLWASLVEHIFDHLHLPDESRPTAIEAMQKHWIDRLGFSEAALKEASDRQLATAERVRAAERAVDAARQAHDRKKEELQRLSAQSAARDFRLGGVYQTVADALAPLGFRPLGDGVSALRTSLREARGVLVDSASVLTPLLRAPDRAQRWRSLLVICLGAPAVGAALGAALALAGAERISQLTGVAGFAATLLTGGARWLRSQTAWLSSAVASIEGAQAAYDDALARALADTAREIARTEQELALTRQEYAAAQQRVEQARRENEQAATELSQATPTRLVARFVQDRASSADYRKHLGLLAVVRDDFEKLSDMIEEENWRLSPADPSDDRSRRTARFASLDEELRDAGVRINRIVLYIDDLDRCPPAKVVDVLQAVHLLLAFPLFIVVVGVDARWVTRSLWTRYRELLHVGALDAEDDPAHLFGVARAEDYLEKIFQIPMWLPPIDAGKARRLVQGMVRGAAPVSAGPVAAWKGDAADATGSAPTAPGGAEGRQHQPADATSQHERRTASPSATGTPGVAAQAASPAADQPRAANVESLEIGRDELTTIDELSPLLGRSPRAIKRFVNIYRLIKAGLSVHELRVFMQRGQEPLAEYEAVLFLLAIDTGLPRLAHVVFDVLRQWQESAVPDQAHAIETLIRHVGSHVDARTAEEWEQLEPWLRGRPADYADPIVLRRLVDWSPVVARYSFQSPMGELFPHRHTARDGRAAPPDRAEAIAAVGMMREPPGPDLP